RRILLARWPRAGVFSRAPSTARRPPETMGPMPASYASSGSDAARAIHRDHPAIDLHADTLMWSRWIGYDLHKAHEPPLPFAALGGHVDLPRMHEGGMAAQFF